MKKFFNVSGPCYPDKHYMLPAQERCKGILDLIHQEQYFVIHAARQTGKTTLLLELERQLKTSGDYAVLYCSLEALEGMVDADEGIPAIIEELRSEVDDQNIAGGEGFAEHVDVSTYHTALRKSLSQFCKQVKKPLIVLFDEVDRLSNGTLISFLRQLRYGYINRGRAPFVHSLALVGMRNIRDYKGKIREDRETLGSASPFNIVSDALTLRNFNKEDVSRLYAQHTGQTGQAFPQEVINRIYDCTRGQPWLVNAAARQIVEKILHSDFSQAIFPEHVEHAIQTIILRRDTHIDSLMERLREERVRRVIEPIIVGADRRYELLDDDYQYVFDLGLLSESERQLVPSNPIYAEVIIRTLSYRSQRELDDVPSLPDTPAYIRAGKLDMTRLLTDFQQFWRENSDIWVEKYQYKEAAPHLILQALLQRVINAGGNVTREMAGGTKRLDLCLHYQGVKYPIELKLRYGDNTYQEGKDQLAGYMDKLGCTEGWLIVFDRRKKTSWSKKIFWQTQKTEEKIIHIVGC